MNTDKHRSEKDHTTQFLSYRCSSVFICGSNLCTSVVPIGFLIASSALSDRFVRESFIIHF